jgi:TetR/AcrR family transcriptional regulator, transcriptional repressor for nem operon
MRVSKKQAAENRERMLKAAARLIRERGISSVGVDALTEAAGMTHGSLYSQFRSKERLVEEAMAYAIAGKRQEVPKVLALSSYVSKYLSPTHRDGPGSGCPLAAVSGEVSRQSRAVRATRRGGDRDHRFSGRGTPARQGRKRSQAIGRYSSCDQEKVGRRTVSTMKAEPKRETYR